MTIALVLSLATSVKSKEPELSLGAPDYPVRITAQKASRWQHDGVWTVLLEGTCTIRSGPTLIRAGGAVLWLKRLTPPRSEEGEVVSMGVDLYTDTDVRIVSYRGPAKQPARLYARIPTRRGVVFEVEEFPSVSLPKHHRLYEKALKVRFPDLPLPWSGPTQEDALFAEKDFHLLANTYAIDRLPEATRIVLHGAAKVSTKDMRLFADDIVVWVESTREKAPNTDQKTATTNRRISAVYGQGAVTLLAENMSLRADRFYLDAITNQGIATNLILRARPHILGAPVTFAADVVHQIDRHTLLAPTGYVSSTHFLDPNWRIAGSNIRVAQDRPGLAWAPDRETTQIAPSGPFQAAPAGAVVVSSRHNVVKVGRFTVFYWPFLARDVTAPGYLIRSVRIGSSGALGSFVKTAWNPYDLGLYRNDWSDVTLHLDHYRDRGPGVGLDFEYEGATRLGFLKSYHIHDRADEERGSTGVPDEAPITDSTRGRLLWRHREFLPEDWRADIEFAYRSDRYFLPVFFPEEFEEDKAQETLFYLRRSHENRMYTGLVQGRINQFDTTVERLPEVGFHLLGQPLWNNQLLLTHHSRLSYLKLRYDNELGLENPHGTGRFDTSNELSLPLRFGALSIEPFVGADFTGYSNHADNTSSDARIATSYGFRSATNLYRTYPFESEFLDIHGLRHIVTLVANYRRLSHISDDPTEFTQYDDPIDGRDNEHHVTFRIRNRWQTKRGTPANRHVKDLLTTDLDYNIYPGDRGRNETRDDFLQFSARCQATKHLAVFSRDNKVNLDEGRLDVLNAGFAYSRWHPVRLSYEHDYVWVEHGSGPDRSISMLKFTYRPRWSRWQLELEQRYDFNGEDITTDDRDEKWLTNTLALSRDLNGWLLVLSAEFNQGTHGDTSVGIQLRPTFLSAGRAEL